MSYYKKKSVLTRVEIYFKKEENYLHMTPPGGNNHFNILTKSMSHVLTVYDTEFYLDYFHVIAIIKVPHINTVYLHNIPFYNIL